MTQTNINLINKYKKEFDHYIKGGKLECLYTRDNDGVWWTDEMSVKDCKKTTMAFALEENIDADNLIFVIADEYAEFRKAIALDEVVEFFTENKKWETLQEESFDYSPARYRVKRAKSQFKIGNIVKSSFSQEPLLIKSILNNEYMLENTKTKETLSRRVKAVDFESQIWKPEKGEIVLKFKDEKWEVGSYLKDESCYIFPFFSHLPDMSFLDELTSNDNRGNNQVISKDAACTNSKTEHRATVDEVIEIEVDEKSDEIKLGYNKRFLRELDKNTMPMAFIDFASTFKIEQVRFVKVQKGDEWSKEARFYNNNIETFGFILDSSEFGKELSIGRFDRDAAYEFAFSCLMNIRKYIEEKDLKKIHDDSDYFAGIFEGMEDYLFDTIKSKVNADEIWL